MKKIKLPKTLLVMLVAPAFLALVLPAGRLMAQSQTETKIRLMADALRARDSGDLPTAKKDLEELLALAPNDGTVQRLLDGVNTSLASQAPAASVAAAPVIAAEPVEVSFPKPSAPAPVLTPEEAAASQADTLAKQENERIKGLIKDAGAKRSDARSLAKDGRFDEASAMLDAAAKTLPANPATKDTLADLQAEKNALLLEKAQYLLKQGDTDGARTALDAYAQATSDNKKVEKISKSIDRVELNPALQPIEKINPKFIADQKEVAKLVAKGRGQYLAGDVDGAQETFRSVESIDASNVVAKSFLTRIANEKAATGSLNHEKTRAQLLEEVANSWQRPGVYIDQGVQGNDDSRKVLPLAQKLNNIQIPSVNFTGVELSKVVSTLTAISQDYDKSEGGKGVNIVLIDPSNKNPQVNITLRDLPLKRILDFITDATGYQYEVQADAIVVRPGGEGGNNLDTEFFPVTRATVIRMTGIGNTSSSAAPAAADPFAAAPAAGGSGGGSGASGGEAQGLRAFLQQAGVDFDGTPKSSLAYDGASIIVTQTAKNIDRIRNILNRYNDVKQVEIEAKFMDVQEGALEELGVNWLVQNKSGTQTFLSSNRSLASGFGSSTSGQSGQIVVPNSTGGSTTTPIIDTAPVLPNAGNFGSNSTSGSFSNSPTTASSVLPGFTPYINNNELAVITGVVGNFNIEAAIRALSQKTGTDLLSSPKVTVLSGNPASLVVAQEFRYPQSYGEVQSQVGTAGNGGGAAGVTITAGTPQEFTMRNVGVELKVTPTVEEDDYSISLDLNPKVTEFDGFVEYGGQSIAIAGGGGTNLLGQANSPTTVTVPSGFFQPIFSTREITTKVTVWDGATIVMGGLTREEIKKTSDKVPILGDIPFLGRAFRSKGESTQKRNLLIFVTANLVSPGGSPKKQRLKSVQPSSIFQNPTLVTPSSSEPRVRDNNGK